MSGSARPRELEPSEAAVALPHLRLQLLLRRRPEWRTEAVAVVDEDRPEAPLLDLSRRALERGLRPGLRLGAARNADLELRAGVVTATDASTFAGELATDLRTFSPRVERCDGRGGPLGVVGAFFVDPRGLGGIYGDASRWAETLHRYLAGRGLVSSVVAGHHALRCLAIARASRGVQVLSPEEERARAAATPLRGAGLSESLCEPLVRLGITTLGALLALRAGELRTRFGDSVAELHRLLSDGAQLPLQPETPELPARAVLPVEPASADIERLAFSLKRAIDEVVRQASERHRVLAQMDLELALDPYGHERKIPEAERVLRLSLEPAAPSSDGRRWLDLWRLRLATLVLPAPVAGLSLEGREVAPDADQLATVAVAPTRDHRGAREALARVAAGLGRDSLVELREHDAHLPEAVARFQRLEPSRASFPARTSGSEPTPAAAIRRLARPRRLSSCADGRPRCPAAIVAMRGPHRLSGGWWGREPGAPCVERDYWYVELADGRLWWVFHDPHRRAWFLQGTIG